MWSAVISLLVLQQYYDNVAAATAEPTDANYWNTYGKEQIKKAIKTERLNQNIAKNVIVFIGDGMGVTTNTAARIFKGQLAGQTGEEANLVWDEFPHVALSKTYNTDRQVADSAGTGCALFTGVKTKYEVIGVDDTIEFAKCSTAEAAAVDSVLVSAEQVGKSTGIVTTARITHATPANLYAHSASRHWEYDGKMPAQEAADGCIDIGAQFLENAAQVEVVLAGGRGYLTGNNTADPEYPDKNGLRADGRNIIEEWQQLHQDQGDQSSYVWNAADFNAVKPGETDFLLGLFESSHMQYEHQRVNDPAGEPSLTEMTEKAIHILQKNDMGFDPIFCARIDHGHHDGNAFRALTDAQELDKAVAKALELVNLEETLIIVTADHSHVMTINGYPKRGNPLFADPDFVNPALIPTKYENHGGQDTAIFATGARAHLFHGVHEDSYVAHVIRYASCMGMYMDDTCMVGNDASANFRFSFTWLYCLMLLLLLRLSYV
ncbi:alkaline phosphatase, tissue-nonspecific isozyme-like [Amphiura filiformis]|uniref:alkaline phosphatase, tissue-nonspecific isozyme-like n=1 Tax=Amphiura filiformis TaxID=82378 RepID=UPI003B211BA5